MNFKTMSPLTILLIIVVALVGTVGVIYAAGQLLTIDGTVTITTKASVTADPSELAWGTLSQGASKDIPVTLYNTGDTATGALTINNNLHSSSGLTITYDNNNPVPAQGSNTIIFTLKVSDTAPPVTTPHTVTILD